MKGRPIVPHCPQESCRDRLRNYNFSSRYGSRTTHLRRPEIPFKVQPEQERTRRLHGVTMRQVKLRCPDCDHEWWSTAGDSSYRS